MPERLDWDIDGRLWPHREASRFVEAGGVRWHVQVIGTGPVMLMLHGTGASTHSFSGLIPFLAPHFQLLVPDLPGQGFSEVPAGADLSMTGMARATAALLDALGSRPQVCVGHSAGAAVLVRMCLDKHIAPRGLVGINAALLPFQGALFKFFSPLAKFLTLQPFVPRLVTWRAQDPDAVRRLLTGTGSHPPQDSIDTYTRLFQTEAHVTGTLAMMAAWDLDTLARDLPELAVPLMLIVGTNDRTVQPAESYEVAARVRGVRVERLTGLGHLAHEEAPERIAPLIEDFAAHVLSAAAAVSE